MLLIASILLLGILIVLAFGKLDSKTALYLSIGWFIVSAILFVLSFFFSPFE